MPILISLNKVLIFSIFLCICISASSCNSTNTNTNKSNTDKPKQSVPDLPTPRTGGGAGGNPTPSNSNNDSSSPSSFENQAERIVKVVQKLEEDLKQPNADPKLKKIYATLWVLPGTKRITDFDGKPDFIELKQKDGIELFDEIIQNINLGIYSPSETIAWLIDQQLLDPKTVDSQGNSLLGKLLTYAVSKDYINDKDLAELDTISKNLKSKGSTLPTEIATELLEQFIDKHFLQQESEPCKLIFFNFLKNQECSLTPEKACNLLEKLLDKQTNNNEEPGAILEILNFLENQNAVIAPEKAADFFKKFIEKGDPSKGSYVLDKKENKKKKLYNHILGLLEKNIQDIDQDQATELLQKAADKHLDVELYDYLLTKGADPNKVQVVDLGESIPFLHYVYSNVSEDGYAALFKKLVDNPKTNINIVDSLGRTLAMINHVENRIELINYLLVREDLDINTFKFDCYGNGIYDTLLDIIIYNCMGAPRANNYLEQLDKNNKWLEILKKTSNHPKFFITPDNINKAHAELKQLKTYTRNSEIISIANKALDILDNSPFNRIS